MQMFTGNNCLDSYLCQEPIITIVKLLGVRRNTYWWGSLFRSVIVRERSSHVLLRVSNNAEGDGRTWAIDGPKGSWRRNCEFKFPCEVLKIRKLEIWEITFIHSSSYFRFLFLQSGSLQVIDNYNNYRLSADYMLCFRFALRQRS